MVRSQDMTTRLYRGGALDSQVTDSQYVRCITLSDEDEAIDIPHSRSMSPIVPDNMTPCLTGNKSECERGEDNHSGYEEETQYDLADQNTFANDDDPGVRVETSNHSAGPATPDTINGHLHQLTDDEWELIQLVRRHVQAQVQSLTARKEEVEVECEQLRAKCEAARVQYEKLDTSIGYVRHVLNTCNL
ncbi:hypothetical protein EYR40_001784 [Pleurotus pulmonarius]|nr:hypothetical protein EYR40_001784 [Pleurotus pulmonarius]